MAEYQILGQPLGYWLQTVAIVASAVFAGWQIKALRKQHVSNDIQWKQRATIDAVMADRKDDNLIRSRRVYAKLKQANTNFDAIGSAPLLENEECNHAILDILNNYEFMAAGIREDAFDEQIYKRMKRSLIIADWQILNIYIQALRKRECRPKLFAEFQWLAEKWQNES
ncbi:Uncharacterised protein [Kingella potus]|uniref:DUF4760 domain-containing protein n=1 Tax=Kingella potus TaxID=265175 RepID=A0A377QYM1_9NEIS|nr:DUF4760 domain-containing protein [Kingella potus]UOP00539.1 DUF4760 domain-containing protein [Kingella potus]UOP02009.1 DUF4760 domain-containing protein [Kingella potus]STQ99840.1 Uncharacterised protein [Kingella potus]